MNLWVVVPTNRPEAAPRIVGNVRRQGVDARLVVVENGPAVGEFAALGYDKHAAVVQQDAQSAPDARNTGMEYARAHGGGLIAFMDDDDIYGPTHLRELVDAWRPGRVVGRADHFLRTRDDSLWLIEGWGRDRPVREVLCQTTLVHSDDALEWRAHHVEDDEPEWYRRMLAAGREVYAVGVTGFCFWNHPRGHLWAPPDAEWPLRAPHVLDLGPYGESIVFGQSAMPDGATVKPSFAAVGKFVARQRRIQKGAQS